MGERKKKRKRRSQKPKEYIKELFKIDLMYYKNKIKLKTQSSQWHVMPEILITFQELISNAKDRLSNTKIPNSKQGHLAQGGKEMQLVRKTLLALHPAWQPSRSPAPSGPEASAFCAPSGKLCLLSPGIPSSLKISSTPGPFTTVLIFLNPQKHV